MGSRRRHGRIGELLGRDPLLARIQARWPGVRLPGGWDEYEVMLRAIVGQQVSVKGAITIMGRLVARTWRSSARLSCPRRPSCASWIWTASACRAAASARCRAGRSTRKRRAHPGHGKRRATARAAGHRPWTVAHWRLRCGLDTDAFPPRISCCKRRSGRCQAAGEGGRGRSAPGSRGAPMPRAGCGTP